MLAAGDCAHAQLIALTYLWYTVTLALASLVSLIIIDADSGPLGSERSLRFNALAVDITSAEVQATVT